MAEPLPVNAEPVSAEVLFRTHAAFVARFLQRVGVPAADVDDLLQEVFVVAHRKGGYLPGPATPRGWLVAIALRVAQAGRRAIQRRERPVGEIVELAQESAGDPAQRLEARRALERVQSALDGLLIEHRAVFMLYEIEGESCEAIAQDLGIPVGTVYSRLHHARRRFLAAYGDEREDSAPAPHSETGGR